MLDLALLCQQLVERSPLAMAATEGQGHVLRCVNSPFCRLAGEEREALLGRPFTEALPASRQDGSLATLGRVYRSGQAETAADLEHRDLERGAVYWTYAVWPLGGDEACPEGLLVQVVDTTEQVVSRERLRQASDDLREVSQRLLLAGLREQKLRDEAEQHAAKLRAVLGAMHEGVTIVDAAAGRIVLINDVARRLVGWPAEGGPTSLEDYRQLDVRSPDGTPLPFAEWPLSRALRGERVDEMEFLLVRPDGSRVHLVATGSAIRDQEGRVELAIVVIRNVTALRQLEQTREEYIGLISHDLRAPLTAVLGYAGLLQRRLDRPDLQQEAPMLRTIAESARRMKAMIQELVDSVRLEAGQVELRKVPTDLVRLASAIVERAGAPEERARIRVECPQPLPPVPVDPEHLERAIVNLVANALKYSVPGMPVVVRVGRSGGQVVISVIDRGVGISAEDLPQIFERYYRAKANKKGGGLGLGLYITRQIVEAHGGRVWAESELGKGSTFSIAVPVSPES